MSRSQDISGSIAIRRRRLAEGHISSFFHEALLVPLAHQRGTCYHSNLYQTESNFEKELEHAAGYASNNPVKSGASSFPQGSGGSG
ncbi:MAG: hypothetical protein ACM3X1_04060 [Ignavibacteriales bacterium]